MLLLILKLSAVHFFLRFICRPDLMALAGSQKRHGKAIGVLGRYSLLFIGSAALLILPWYKSSPLTFPKLVILILAAAISSFAVNLILIMWFIAKAAKGGKDFEKWCSWQMLLATEGLQIFFFVLIADGLHPVEGFPGRLLSMWSAPSTFGLVSAFAISVGLGSVLVPLITHALEYESKEGIKRAGRYIGIFERLLLTTLIIFWPKLDATAIGLVFSAKSIVRFPELRSEGQQFAEYYLVGTLTSFTLAIVTGLAARYYFPQLAHVFR